MSICADVSAPYSIRVKRWSQNTRMSVAAKRAGVNSNVLTDENEMDPLSGNSVMNGIPVTVAPVGV